MEPIIPWWVIYLADVSSPIRLSVIVGSVIALTLVGILYGEKECELIISRATLKKIFCVSLVCLMAGLLIPTREAIYLMLAAHYVTPDNLAAFGGSIKEFIDYLLDGIAGIIQSGE